MGSGPTRRMNQCVRADHRLNCFELSRIQLSFHNIPCASIHILCFSGQRVGDWDTSHATSADTTTAQASAPARRVGSGMVMWGEAYMTFTVIALLTGNVTAAATQNHHAARVEVWDCQHPMSTAVYNGRTYCSTGASNQFQQQLQNMALAQVMT